MTLIKDRCGSGRILAAFGDICVRQPPTLNVDSTAKRRLGLAAAGLLTAGLFAAERAGAHMAALKAICGGGDHPHCAWCYAAAALIFAGLAALTLAASPLLKLETVRSRKAGRPPFR